MTDNRVISWFKRFVPAPWTMGFKERLRASLGVFLGLGTTAIMSRLAVGGLETAPLLIAPMGASAVLLFALPASPLAQPWSVIGGHLVAALVGVTTLHFISTPLLAAPLSVAIALGLMTILRCVHPPSGAIALIAVLGGPKITEMGYGFALVPVLLNSVLLTTTALIFNNATGKSFPHMPHPQPQPVSAGLNLTQSDIDAVLSDYGEALDIAREDLEGLYQSLLARAQSRQGPN